MDLRCHVVLHLCLIELTGHTVLRLKVSWDWFWPLSQLKPELKRDLPVQICRKPPDSKSWKQSRAATAPIRLNDPSTMQLRLRCRFVMANIPFIESVSYQNPHHLNTMTSQTCAERARVKWAGSLTNDRSEKNRPQHPLSTNLPVLPGRKIVSRSARPTRLSRNRSWFWWMWRDWLWSFGHCFLPSAGIEKG